MILRKSVAVRADTQFYIEKLSTDDVTTSTVRKLKVEVVARMLAEDDITVEALAQAKRLLRK